MRPADFARDYLGKLKAVINALNLKEIESIINELKIAHDQGKQIITFGNGGSAATATHFCGDLNKGVSYGQKKKFRAICLSDNVPTMMAYGNDVGYEDIFIEPLKNFLQSGDIVIGFSGSGNSRNVIKAIQYANTMGNTTIGFCGYDGGDLKKISKFAFHVAVDDMQKVEDIHLIVAHLIMQYFVFLGLS